MTTKTKWANNEVQEHSHLYVFEQEYKNNLTCHGCNRTIWTHLFCRSSDKAGTKPGLKYDWCLTCKPLDIDWELE